MTHISAKLTGFVENCRFIHEIQVDLEANLNI